MATLQERVSAQESKADQLDKRLTESRGDVREGFNRIDRAIDGLRSEINGLRKLLVGILIAIVTGMTTISVLLLIALLTG